MVFNSCSNIYCYGALAQLPALQPEQVQLTASYTLIFYFPQIFAYEIPADQR
jgi:hypothetical protein